MGALSHLRVVEVGDDIGAYAGKLFAELGASVVRVSTTDLEVLEAPQFDPDPFVQDFLHRSKRRVQLSADPAARTDALARLIGSADVLLEAGPPDLLERLGIPARHPCLVRASLIRTRITPYGIDGDRAQDPVSDLVCSASAGFLFLGGWPDRAPTRAHGDQSWRMASLHAAVGAMLALFEREESGLGQQVDVSAEEAVATALENALQFFDLEGTVRTRTGAGYDEAGTGVYACADGYVYVMVGRLSTARGWASLLDFLDEAEAAGASVLRREEWSDQRYRKTARAQKEFRTVFEQFAANWRKKELYVEAQRRGIAICPINTPDDLLEDEHLLAREFFLEVDGARVVGAPYRLSATPWAIRPHVLDEELA